MHVNDHFIFLSGGKPSIPIFSGGESKRQWRVEALFLSSVVPDSIFPIFSSRIVLKNLW